uniref:Serine protease snake n=3 Tax=Lygus hesperus TaxID=30085 RepID=A0A0A9X0K6_LYGHE
MGPFPECLLVILLIYCAASYDGQYREEGDACGEDGSNWTCQRLSKCPAARRDLKTRSSPLTKVCSVFRGVPIVCCPPSDLGVVDRGPTIPTKPTSSISQIMCKKYARFVWTKRKRYGEFIDVDQCGQVEEPLIVNGKNASLKEFPHMAQIGYWFREQQKILYLCGGSLISERWVLSAAHCTNSPTFGKAQFVRLGELDTSSDRDGANPIVLKISELINHEGWNGMELYNDIALYKLERDVTLTPYIRPICLQVDHTLTASAGLATGWGHTKWEGVGSPILQKVWLDLIDNAKCNKSYGIQIQIPQGVEESKMLCTTGRGVRDTCQGDSGGPLQLPVANPYCMYYQIGVTSFGVECASKFPGVYTRVSHYLPWIEKHVWPNERGSTTPS